MEVDIATAKALLNVDDIGWFVKKILSGFKRAATMEVSPKDEGFLAANDSGVLQFGGDAARRVTRPKHDKGLARRLQRGQKSPGEPPRCSE